MKKEILLIPALLFIFFLSSCTDDSYKQTETGLTYKFHDNNKGDKPSVDDIAKIDFNYRYPADSVFFSSSQNQGSAYVRVIPSEYEGDIYEALRMMAAGDSASFMFDANNFFSVTMGAMSVPEFINPEDSIYVDIVMHEFFNEEEYEAYMQKQREEQMEEQENASMNETKILDEYLDEQNIDVQPEESGLIIIVEEEGSGPKPEPGQNVKVHYTGMVLDGTVFDSSVERGEPIEFTLGSGQVIPGWDEGISKINVGSKARLIIPSHLAYGDKARSELIQPFSTLIFDIELISAE